MQGRAPVYHVLTVEAFVNLLQNFFNALFITSPPVPITSTGDFNLALIAATITKMFTLSVVPATGSILPFLLPINAAFALATSPVTPYGAVAGVDLVGAFPGIGHNGFLVG